MATPILLAFLGFLLGNSTKKKTQQEAQIVRTLGFTAGFFLMGMFLATVVGGLVPRKISTTHFTLGCLPVAAKDQKSNCQLKPINSKGVDILVEATRDSLAGKAIMQYTTSEPDITSPLYLWSLQDGTHTSISIQQPETSTR